METQSMPASTTVIIGASAGFGAATADALASHGHHVIAVARDADRLTTFASSVKNITPVVGDGRDPALAKALLAEHQPTSVLLGGGATPHMAPLENHSFETLSLNWNHDVAIAFNWLHTILNHPSERLAHTIVISSGAGLFGSPGSGGYAGAKATTRFLTASAADSATRLGHATRFTTVNPKLTSATETGRAAVAGYARINGGDAAAVLAAPPPYDSHHAGSALAELITNPSDYTADDYLLTEGGLQAV